MFILLKLYIKGVAYRMQISELIIPITGKNYLTNKFILQKK